MPRNANLMKLVEQHILTSLTDKAELMVMAKKTDIFFNGLIDLAEV